MKQKLGDVLLVSFLLVFISIFGVWKWVKVDINVSDLENRKLQLRPDATVESILSGEYFKRFETYYSDQFPARDLWIEGNSIIDKHLLLKDVIRSVYVHNDGYLISPVDPSSGSSTEEIANKVNELASKTTQDLYFALAPNKATVMEYKIPKYVTARGNELSDALMKEFSKEVIGIDPRSLIKEHLEEPNMYFYTDHHWKPRAAHYVYETIIENIAEKHPSVGDPIPKDQFEWIEDPTPFYGSDSRKTTKPYVEKVDTVTIVKPKFKEEPLKICYRGSCDRNLYDTTILESEGTYANHYKVYFSGDVSEGVVYNPNIDNGLKLLILKDSYVNPMIQFLVRNFSETRLLDLRHYDKQSVYDYMNNNDIDLVLMVHNVNSIYLTSSFLDFENPGDGENQ